MRITGLWHRAAAFAVFAAVCACAQESAPATPGFDIIVSGGSVLDGSGSTAKRADVGIRGDTIAAIGDLSGQRASRTIDATGLTIIPGVIDLHSHADEGPNAGGLRSRNAQRRAAPNLVAQGVTSVVVNMDGRSPIDIGKQREALEERGIGPNVALMVGHNAIRQKALGSDFERAATEAEIGAMREMVIAGMEAGAYGLSAGLEYVPGIWAETSEVEALVAAVKPYGGVYIVHERASGSDPMWYVPSQDAGKKITTMLDSINETIRIAEATGVTSVATHIKARGMDYWGSSEAMIAAIEDARSRGVPIFADQYPYNTSGSDGGITLLPRWIEDEGLAQNGGGAPDFATSLRALLEDPLKRAAIERDVLHQIERRGGAENIVVFQHPNPAYVGKSLAELAEIEGLDPLHMAYALQLGGFANWFGGARLRGFSMSEEDIEHFAKQPWCATASDAGIALPGDGPVHARYYGTFPRKIRHYAIERGVLSVEQAVRSMTSLPAEILGFERRGLIKEGYAADLAVINLETIRDTATFFEPHQYPEGVEYVLINGKLAVDSGELTWALPGQVLTPENSRRSTD